MAETENQRILAAIEKQGERAERLSRDQMSAIQGLANELRDFGQNVSQAVTRHSFNGGKTGNGVWPILFGIGALVFGLMAPLYIMITGISMAQSKHESLVGHPETASAMAALNVNLQEIETQFRGVREVIATMKEGIDEDNSREVRDISSAASREERVRHLERKVFGWPTGPRNENQLPP